ncbi:MULTISPECIES: hypothetical protein [unclassified Psychrobacter]|uniref:hypothetical protein n=1 Tax=unclassified Psychrobacter TaxID=196806 RepID=UPI00384BB8A6
MNQILRKEILDLLASELTPDFLDDYIQQLNGRYLEAIDYIKDRYLVKDNSHAAQKMFNEQQLHLAEIALQEVAGKHGFDSHLLFNTTNSDQYINLSSESFNLLLVRGQAKNKYRGKYKAYWASVNSWLEDKQLTLDLGIETAYDTSKLIEERITIVIEVLFSMTNITGNFSLDMEPKAYIQLSIPNSENTKFLTTFSFDEIRATAKALEEPLLNESEVKPNLVSIKKRFNEVVNE